MIADVTGGWLVDMVDDNENENENQWSLMWQEDDSS